MKPIVKWPGGKRKLLPEIKKRLPSLEGMTYIEPFVGAGAVLFDLMPEKAVVNDANRDLINLYEVTRDNPDDLFKLLSEYSQDLSAENFYRIRNLTSPSLTPVEHAARFIYLNKAGYNGVYRVNSKGKFNVPHGKKKKIDIPTLDELRAMGSYLGKNVDLFHGDFEGLRIRTSDFWYIDPPYLSLGGFVEYTKEGFDIHDHYRLYEMCRKIDRSGSKFLLSNACNQFTLELYSEFIIERVQNERGLGRKKAKPKKDAKEILVRNYAL